MPLPKINTPSYELTLPSNGKKIKYRPFLVREEKILIMALETEDMKQITDAVLTIQGVSKLKIYLHLILNTYFLMYVRNLLVKK